MRARAVSPSGLELAQSIGHARKYLVVMHVDSDAVDLWVGEEPLPERLRRKEGGRASELLSISIDRGVKRE